MTLAEVRDFAAAKLTAFGCDAANAAAVADTIALAERDGAHSHGLFRMPGYLASLKSGKVNGKANPTTKPLRPGVLHCDGDNGYAPLALQVARAPLAEMARSQGVAVLALTRTHHFAALWVEVEALAEMGLVALACTSFKPALPPAGGRKPVYGTNPLAFAWPREGGPVVVDQASAVMARGEVMIAAQEGRELPPGVGIGPDGAPTTDPNAILKGALLPFGGYKGASIAMMVELLAGPLIGERLSLESAAEDQPDGGPPRGGEFILAIDPGGTRGDGGWAAHAEALFTAMLSEDGVRLPGDGRRARRERIAREGVAVDSALLAKI
jgi:delta1-piperideine-2-carboxylate reductase